jgi:hypothetical protein
MIKDVIFWVIFAAMVVGGLLAGGPLIGVLGCAGLWAVGGSFKSRKDNGVDGRFRVRFVRLLVGLGCIAAAIIIAMMK